MKNKTILVTGGAGYIGSHIVLSCLRSGCDVIVVDKDEKACEYLKKCFRRRKKLSVFNADIENDVYINGIMTNNKIDAVVHCAAYVSAPESIHSPLKYYENNTAKTLKLLQMMKSHGVNTFVFASSAAVYGNVSPDGILRENDRCKPTTPYGESKLMVETVLKKHAKQSPAFRYVSLRFFNAAGNDIDNKIQDINWSSKTNLIPQILKSIIKGDGSVKIYGTDLPTPDGTCIRDYIHPTDIASAVLISIENENIHGVFNLGTNKGSTVWEVIKEIVSVTQSELDIKHIKPRDGDPPLVISESTKFQKASGWEPAYNLREIVESAYKSYRKVSK